MSSSSAGEGVDVQNEYYRYFPYMDVYVADTTTLDNRRTMQVLPASSRGACYPTNTEALGYTPESNKCYTSVPIESFFPLSSCTIGGYIFSCPHRPAVGLKLLYGESYRTPVKSVEDGVGTDSEELPDTGARAKQQQAERNGGQAQSGGSEITEELLSFELASGEEAAGGGSTGKKAAPEMEYGKAWGDIDEDKVRKRKAENLRAAAAAKLHARQHEVLHEGGETAVGTEQLKSSGKIAGSGRIAGSGKIAGRGATAKEMALTEQVKAYAKHNQEWCQKELETNPGNCAETEFQTKCNGFGMVSQRTTCHPAADMLIC
jgi:hypothetical protein